ncbi:YggU-like protein [Mytilinidion resinicola]|uniref:YggU-like protein n=1 Tax=Mytilinidion resinicola TaxID=574789 RepID=A0A6A6YGM8_9PEZI|nr:YggU-like protein [Mytilinidion resinicola]KAF2807962.1 YggU-like protein [Mytilinidion resinicola]
MLPAIRLTASKPPSRSHTLHLLCHVKPGAASKREGVSAVTASGIELCVAARAREGEANRAVRALIAEVLHVPKSDVEIAKGMKSREKTVVVSNITIVKSSIEETIEGIRIKIEQSVST